MLYCKELTFRKKTRRQLKSIGHASSHHHLLGKMMASSWFAFKSHYLLVVARKEVELGYWRSGLAQVKMQLWLVLIQEESHRYAMSTWSNSEHGQEQNTSAWIHTALHSASQGSGTGAFHRTTTRGQGLTSALFTCKLICTWPVVSQSHSEEQWQERSVQL